MGTRTSASISSTTSPREFTTGSRRTSYPKSDINVNLSDHYSSKVYTSGSTVTGNVTITTRRDVPFDSIQIVLLGHTKTTFDGVNIPQEVYHTFLKMLMPIPESTYPVPRVLETGHTYTIPFNFVIPHQLTINACNHARLSEQVQDHHVLLPPSLGGWERDDMAPKMARVEYTIKARVLREDVVGSRKTRIMEATQNIQVLPASIEEPPLNITANDKLYRMSKTKTLRRNLLSTKLGRLTAEAAQPGAAILSADGRRVMSHPMARVKLTFDPDSTTTTLPPSITSVSAKLTAHTYFSSGTISSFPNLGVWNEPYILDRRGQFFTSTPLPAVTLAEQPAWTPVYPSGMTRRDSGYCSSDSEHLPTPSSSPSSKKSSSSSTSTKSQLLTTTLTIPLSLPTDKKTLVPTFHSCIASRVYTVQLTLHTTTRGSSNTLSLSLPLQIAVEGGGVGSPVPLTAAAGHYEAAAQNAGGSGLVVVAPPPAFGLPSFEEAAADDHLRPRVLHVPDEEVFASAREGRGSWMLQRQSLTMGEVQVSRWEEVQETAVPVGVGAGDTLPGYGEFR
ncbi:hypothetical protein VTI74DRAFT_11302 [Chaetomium olivicolor]